MIIRQESGNRWLPVRIDDVEKWQEGLLEESARRLGAVLAPSGRVRRWGFVGSPVTFRGQRAWLRVSPFLEHEMSRKAPEDEDRPEDIPAVPPISGQDAVGNNPVSANSSVDDDEG